MKKYYKETRENLCFTIGNYIKDFQSCKTREERILQAKIMFDYIITQKNNVLNLNIMNEGFVSTMKDKLIHFHNVDNISWAYNYYLILFDEVMPV